VLHKADGSNQNISTGFTYRPFGLVGTITDDKNNITTSTYDLRGRRTSLTHPDQGTHTTSYYGTGEIKTDSRSDLTSTTYDDLGRQLTSTSSVDGTTTFSYDTAPNGIGKIAIAASPERVTTGYRYDLAGRLAGTDVKDAGNGNRTYSTDVSYDGLGRPETLAYPDPDGAGGAPRFTVKTSYNAAGYPNKITNITGGGNTDLWTVTARKPNFALYTGELGAGAGKINLTRNYQPATGRLSQISATTGATTLQSLTYGYYDNGLVHTREQLDPQADRREEFTYDSLSRLTGWDLILPPPNSNQDDVVISSGYGYDTIGNLTSYSRSDAGSETRSYGKLVNATLTQPHTLTSAGTNTYSYDAKGRQTSGGGRQNVTYTSFDLPRTITTSGNQVTLYRYDAYGRRAKETNGVTGTTTFYVPGLYEEQSRSGSTTKQVFYVTSPDGPVAQVSYDHTASGITTTTLYQLSDQLGSTTTAVDTGGAVKQTNFFDPFGQSITATGTPVTTRLTGPVTHTFTGHEDDSELGLLNMKGRVYDPRTARFLTPDPLVTNPTDSQSWNPYSYVNNSPLNHTDPTGHYPCQTPIGVFNCYDSNGGLTTTVDYDSPIIGDFDRGTGFGFGLMYGSPATYEKSPGEPSASDGVTTKGPTVAEPPSRDLLDEPTSDAMGALNTSDFDTAMDNLGKAVLAAYLGALAMFGFAGLVDLFATAAVGAPAAVAGGSTATGGGAAVGTAVGAGGTAAAAVARTTAPAGNGNGPTQAYPVSPHQETWAQELIHTARGSQPAPCGDLCAAVFENLEGRPTAVATSTPYMTPAQMADRLRLPEAAARPVLDGFAGVANTLESMGEGAHAAVIGAAEGGAGAHWFNVAVRDGQAQVVDAYFGISGSEQIFINNVWAIFGSGPVR
jgi:RHS repeat-associated protein